MRSRSTARKGGGSVWNSRLVRHPEAPRSLPPRRGIWRGASGHPARDPSLRLKGDFAQDDYRWARIQTGPLPKEVTRASRRYQRNFARADEAVRVLTCQLVPRSEPTVRNANRLKIIASARNIACFANRRLTSVFVLTGCTTVSPAAKPATTRSRTDT